MFAPLQLGGTVFPLVALLLLVIAAVAVYQAVEIVNAYEKRALTVFGEYRRLLEPGISFIPPFVSQTYTFDMRTQTLDVPRQEAITRDNSPVTRRRRFWRSTITKKPSRTSPRRRSGPCSATWNSTTR